MYTIDLHPEPVYHSYAGVANHLNTHTSQQAPVNLINRITKDLIGSWRWVDGVIKPIGPIDFTKVTETQGAEIGSVTGNVLDLSDSTFVVTGGYTLRIWNTTDGALVSDVVAGSWTRSGAGIAAGAAVAATVAALIAAGKSIRCWVEGLSELSIGGETSAIRPLALGTARHAAGLLTTGRVLGYLGSICRGASDWACRLEVSIDRSAEDDDQIAYAGVYQDATRHFVAGLTRTAGTDRIGGSYGAIAAPTAAVSEASGGVPSIMIYSQQKIGGAVYPTATDQPLQRSAFVAAAALTAAPTALLLRSSPGAGEAISIRLNRATFV